MGRRSGRRTTAADPLVEVPLEGGSLGEDRRELVGPGDEVGQLVGGDAERESGVGGTAAVSGATNELVQHTASTEVLEHEDVLGPFAPDRSLSRDVSTAAREQRRYRGVQASASSSAARASGQGGPTRPQYRVGWGLA